MGFDLAHALIAVIEHRLIPLGVEQPRTGLESHLLIERAHTTGAARSVVCDIDGHALSPGALYRTTDTAERSEVVVDGGHAQLNGVQVLIGEVDIFEDAIQQC